MKQGVQSIRKRRAQPDPHAQETLDDPALDGTDAAHPAWHRGDDHGAVMTAKALLRVAQHGKRGNFADEKVDAAATVIAGVRTAMLTLSEELSAAHEVIAQQAAVAAEYAAARKELWHEAKAARAELARIDGLRAKLAASEAMVGELLKLATELHPCSFPGCVGIATREDSNCNLVCDDDDHGAWEEGDGFDYDLLQAPLVRRLSAAAANPKDSA